MAQEQFIKQKEIYDELADLFPALEKYKTHHNKENLQKLCVEIAEFCTSVFASTRSEPEREVFFGMLDKLKKL